MAIYQWLGGTGSLIQDFQEQLGDKRSTICALRVRFSSAIKKQMAWNLGI
jgi:hypothetical protein